MKSTFKKFLTVMLTLTMLLGMMAPAMYAAEELKDIAGTYVDKTAEPLDENDCTDVTLTVPGTMEGYIDVVFVLGGGMTANMETIESAINVFKPAMESGKATVRMGLISLEKGKEIILDLNSDEAILDPATYVDFVTEKFDSINDLPAGTTNLHSQLLEAQDMLAKETLAKPENKYVFVLATGRTYWFDDANGEQATIVNKVNGTYYWANYLWQSQRGLNTSLYMIPDRYNDSYEAFFADIEKWVAADSDTYVFTPHFDKADYSAYANWYNLNNKDLRALGLAGSRYGLGIVNPAPTADNFITGVPAAIGSGTNPQNALNYERAQYECVQVWKELVSANYNCYSICSENPNYQNDSEYIKLGAKYTGTSTTQLGHSFMNYLATLAGQKEAPTVWDYERDADGNMLSATPVLQKNFFDSVREDMLYTCSKGSTVVDYIGKNENGNFEFIENADYLKLVIGGVEYSATVAETAKHIDENGEDAKSSYAFTAPGATEPTFWLDYFYGDGKTTERFVWTFGENVSMDRLATLTYKLLLTEKSEILGKYIVPTNNSATLYPVDNEGNPGKPVDFPVPEVEYEVKNIDISGTKIWNDGDNCDNKRPEFITINLLADGVEVDEVEVSADENGEWNYTFENLREYKDGAKIVYTITEDPVEGYTTEIDGYNVINTHVPEQAVVSITKVWDDDDNSAGLRPDSIIVELYANGELIATQEITEADGWVWSFNELPKYENGVEIEYTVKEVEIADEYVATIEGSVAEGFTITNTYSVEMPDNPPPLAPPTGDTAILTASIAAIASILLAAFVLNKKKTVA